MEKKMFGLLSLGVIALLGISMVAAYQGDYSVEGPNYSEERHADMQDAFDGLDYAAWVTLMTADGRHSRVVDVVTADNFETFVEAHEAGKSGDVEKVARLRAELGLKNGMGSKDGSGFKGEMGSRKGSMRSQGRHMSLK